MRGTRNLPPLATTKDLQRVVAQVREALRRNKITKLCERDRVWQLMNCADLDCHAASATGEVLVELLARERRSGTEPSPQGRGRGDIDPIDLEPADDGLFGSSRIQDDRANVLGGQHPPQFDVLQAVEDRVRESRSD